MRYTVVFELSGALAGAAAVEWTEAAALPGAAWQPCQRLPGDRWHLAAAGTAHRREPGLLSHIGLRYRLSATGPWSPISASRKEIVIVAAREEDLRDPPAATAADWTALPPQELGGSGAGTALALNGAPSAAVAVQWTHAAAPGEVDWRFCAALGHGAWAIADAGAGIDPIGIRYRLTPEGAWSPASKDRKALALPLALAAPTLSGTGRIGAALTAQPGNWSGTPAVAFQWRRDGADIAGATAKTYVLGSEDDLCELTCRVTATNAAGSAAAETAALRVTHAAPEARGTLPDATFTRGTGLQTVAVAGGFAGAALRFAVAGAGATVDAATGVVSIPTDASADGAEATVTAVNSGGAASSRFRVTVKAIEIPLAPRLDQMILTTAWDPGAAAGTFRIDVALADAPGTVEAVEWSSIGPAGALFGAPESFHPCVLADGRWQASARPGSGPIQRFPKVPTNWRYRWRIGGEWSPPSANAAAQVTAPVMPVLPAVLAAPTLSGTAKIGAALTVLPGLWSGGPALAFQWRRDGTDIAGATAVTYVPGPEDDRCELSCRVVALNVAGSASAETAALKATYVAPVARGALFDEVFDQGTGPQTVVARGDFSGAALSFAVAGAAATVDPMTGIVSIPTDAAIDGAEVTVTATNSGGSASSRFLVTVEAVDGEGEIPLPPRLDQMTFTTAWDPSEAAGTVRIDVTLAGAPGPVEAVEWSSVGPASALFGTAEAFHPCVLANGRWQASQPFPKVPGNWRYRWRIGGEWSLPSPNAAALVVAPTRPRADPPRWKAVPTRTPEEAAAGMFGGDCGQAYFSAAVTAVAPGRVIAGQDMGQMARSADFGGLWESCPARGYRVQSTQSCAVDPDNPDIVLFSSSCFHQHELRPLEGIYRSTDGGNSYTLVQPIPFMAHIQTYPMYHFATDPATKGATRVWYYCWRGTTQASRTDFLDGHIWKSTDNGLTWKILTAGALTAARFGRLDTLIHHPARAGELYLACEKGLFRNTAGGVGGPATWMAVGDLPAGKRVRTLCIDPRDNRQMWCSVDGMGLYRSVDSGATWTRKLAPWWTVATGVDHSKNSMRVAVGADGMAIWAIGGNNTQGKVSLDAGASWQTVTVTGRPGDPKAFTTKLMGEWGHVVPHPTEPRTALAASWAEWWKTENGKDWVQSQAGVLGISVGWSPSCWWFDKDDWRRMAIGPADLGFIMTDNAWSHVEYNNVPQTLTIEVVTAADAATGGNSNEKMRSAGGVLRWPSGHPRRDWALAAVGDSWNKAVYKSADNGRNWQPAGITTTVGGQTVAALGRNYFLGQSWQDPNVVYAGRYKTTDGGARWTALAGMSSVVAISKQDHDTLYAYSVSTNAAGIAILRSDDGGKTWRTWYANAAGNRSDSRPVVCVDPHDHDTLYAIDRVNFDVVRITAAGAEDIGVRGLTPSAIGFSVAMIAVDHRDRNLIYVLTNQHGLPHVLRSRDRGATWQDITGNKYGVAGGSIAVHPLTGDVFVGGSRGNYCFPPPEGYHAAHGIDPAKTVWGSLWT